MYHNKKSLSRISLWLKIISWFSIPNLIYFFSIFDIGGSLSEQYQSSLGPLLRTFLPEWIGIGLYGSNLIYGLISPLIFFLFFQGSAATIDYLLAFAEKMKIGEEPESPNIISP